MIRNIVHLDLDCFFVSCEILKDASLKHKPVVIGGKSNRGVVASCSYEARHFGVRSAMPMRYALQLCPDALVIRGDMDLYSNCSKLVTTIIREASPSFEKASIDEFYLDLSGMDQFRGCYQWTQELVEKIRKESGLALSFGLSVNKTVSKIATNECKPNGKLQVAQGEVQPFLNPLSVAKIPMVGKKTFYTLSRVGIRKIKTLAEMPQEFMEQLLGQNGKMIWQKANGIDNQAVVPYTEQKSMSAERTFEQDTINIPYIKSLLLKLTEDLTFDLRKSRKLTSIVTVKLRYTNFDTHTRQKRIAYTASDHQLIKVVQELFDQVYQRRMLIRLVGVKFSGLVSGFSQIDLFEDSGSHLALNQAMDGIKRKFGKQAIQRASSLKISKKKRP